MFVGMTSRLKLSWGRVREKETNRFFKTWTGREEKEKADREEGNTNGRDARGGGSFKWR